MIMMTAHVRRLADRFSGWVDTFWEAPFEGSSLYAALAKAELSIEVVAAKIGVTPAKLMAYAEDGVHHLYGPQQEALKRIFARRGVFEILLPWLEGVVAVMPILRRNRRPGE